MVVRSAVNRQVEGSSASLPANLIGGVMFQLIMTLLSISVSCDRSHGWTESQSDAMHSDETCGQMPDDEAHVFGMC